MYQMAVECIQVPYLPLPTFLCVLMPKKNTSHYFPRISAGQSCLLFSHISSGPKCQIPITILLLIFGGNLGRIFMVMLNHFMKNIMCQVFFFFHPSETFSSFIQILLHTHAQNNFKISSILSTKITNRKSSDTDSSVSI